MQSCHENRRSKNVEGIERRKVKENGKKEDELSETEKNYLDSMLCFDKHEPLG